MTDDGGAREPGADRTASSLYDGVRGQERAVAQLRALGLELGELGLALVQAAVIAAPRQQAVGPGDRIAGEIADDDQRQRRHRRTADQSQAARGPSHALQRITMTP